MGENCQYKHTGSATQAPAPKAKAKAKAKVKATPQAPVTKEQADAKVAEGDQERLEAAILLYQEALAGFQAAGYKVPLPLLTSIRA